MGAESGRGTGDASPAVDKIIGGRPPRNYDILVTFYRHLLEFRILKTFPNYCAVLWLGAL